MNPASFGVKPAAIALSIAIALAVCAAAPVAAAAGQATQPPAPDQVVDQFQKNAGAFKGYRRNHAEGVCVTGYFQSSGNAAKYSTAQVFARGQRTRVLGRFSIAGTDPHAADSSTPVRGLGLTFQLPGNQQWQTAMINAPVFLVSRPEGFYDFLKAQHPDPATGKPVPGNLDAFFAAHPETAGFMAWAKSTTPSASYATQRYNSLDAFVFVDAQGKRHAVRWSLLPETHAAAPAMSPEPAGALAVELSKRLAHETLKWQLSVTLANPGDPTDNATRAWPANRRQIDAGTLVIDASQPQATGACRDVTFVPLTLPKGIEPSDDPLPAFRSAAYIVSHARRVGEESRPAGATSAPPAPATHP